MEKLQLQLKSKKFQFKTENETSILVKIGFGLNCKIIQDADQRFEVTGHLEGWNFATGIVPLQMKWLMAYNFICAFLISGLLVFTGAEPFTSPFFYDLLLVLLVLSNIYYQIRFHYFKLLVYMWLQ